MTYPNEILGPIVDQIRTWRKAGVAVSDIVARLRERHGMIDLNGYLRAAFCDEMLNVLLLPRDGDGNPRADIIDEVLGAKVDQARREWESAPPYPDLYRRRDRHAFRAMAKKLEARILVGAADGMLSRGYKLQGIYNLENRNLWKAPQAEAIRFELNQLMGAELIQRGPIDCQEELPRVPLARVLVFEPDGNVSVRDSVQSLRDYYRYRYLPWDQLYGEAAGR